MDVTRKNFLLGAGAMAATASAMTRASIGGVSGRARGLMGGAFMGALMAQRGGHEQVYDYLDGDGVAYVLLPIKTSDGYTVEIDFEVLDGWKNCGIFGGYHNWSQSSRYAQCGCAGNILTNRSMAFYGDNASGKTLMECRFSAFDVGVRFHLVYHPNGNGLLCNGETIWTMKNLRDPPVLSTVSQIPMMLYNCAVGYDTIKQTNSAKMRVRRFKITENGVVKFDFIPRVVNGVAGVGNTVDGTVLFPASGAFTAGVDPK